MKCPNCKQVVPKKTLHCPQCGAALKRKHTALKWILIVAALLLCAALVWYFYWYFTLLNTAKSETMIDGVYAGMKKSEFESVIVEKHPELSGGRFIDLYDEYDTYVVETDGFLGLEAETEMKVRFDKGNKALESITVIYHEIDRPDKSDLRDEAWDTVSEKLKQLYGEPLNEDAGVRIEFLIQHEMGHVVMQREADSITLSYIPHVTAANFIKVTFRELI